MAFHIGGQAPTVNWKRNVGRKKRTIEQAVDIARANGVDIPVDVVFVVAEAGDLGGRFEDFHGMETARGPQLYEHADGYIYWSDHYNRFGKVEPGLSGNFHDAAWSAADAAVRKMREAKKCINAFDQEAMLRQRSPVVQYSIVTPADTAPRQN